MRVASILERYAKCKAKEKARRERAKARLAVARAVEAAKEREKGADATVHDLPQFALVKVNPGKT